MKKLTLAMPQLIRDIDPFEIKQATEECLTNLDQAIEVECLHHTTSLMRLTLTKHSYYFVYNSNTRGIEYFVRHRKVDLGNLLPIKPGRQVLVKRTKASVLTAGIAAKVFWNYLFPEYHCLVTDSQQTEKGREFWSYMIKEAFERGKTVRIINTNDRTFVEPKDVHEFDNMSLQIWGSVAWFQRMAVAIF